MRKSSGGMVAWEFWLTCPGCDMSLECTAGVFPKDSGVFFGGDEFEEHVDLCPDFQAKYRKLMGYD